MKKILVFVLFAVLLTALVGCAPGTNVDLNDEPNSEIQFTTPGPNPELDTAGGEWTCRRSRHGTLARADLRCDPDRVVFQSRSADVRSPQQWTNV